MWFLCVFGSILLVVVRSDIDLDAETRVLLRAQCKAMCLQYFEHSGDAAIDKIINRLGARTEQALDCFHNRGNNCGETCFSACDRHPNDCRSDCPVDQVNPVGCHLGCIFLADIHANRPGKCPLPEVPSDKEKEAGSLQNPSPPSSCHKLCHNDTSCYNPLQKCCAFDCNKNCTIPTYSEAVPPLPPRLTLKPVAESSDIMLIALDSTETNYSSVRGPHVFVFQMRFCTCDNFTDKEASPWQTILMAVETSTTMDAFSSDRKYQFRMAAVNPYGSRGFGPASQTYSFIPLPPRPPGNVTVTKWRIDPNGEVSVHLSWSPPEPTFLPLVNYSVSWALHNGKPLQDSNSLSVQSAQTKNTEITIKSLLLDSSYKVQVTSIYSHNQGILESYPQNFLVSTQFLLPAHRQLGTTFEGAKHTDGANDDDGDDGACRCSSLGRNDERLEINPPEVFNGDLTALVQFKSFSHMDTQSYLIEWFPQVCIDSTKNTPFMTPAVASQIASNAVTSNRHLINTNSEVRTATVRSRIFRLTELKFNCVYMVRLTPEEAVDVAARFISPSPPQPRQRQQHLVQGVSSVSASLFDMAVDVIQGCFCTRSCRETKTAWGTKPINCPAAEPELPEPPRDIQVKLINFDRLDYRVSWYPPALVKGPSMALLSGASNPASATAAAVGSSGRSIAFTRYRVLWAPRKEEPVEASMYNDEAGFSPIPDLQQSYVRVLDKNKTSLILPRLRPRTFYILKIQTLSPASLGQERESPPALHYFFTHDDGFHSTDKRTNGFFSNAGAASYSALFLRVPLWMTALHILVLS